MDGVLRSIHKIRKLREREERLDLVRAEAEATRREQRLQRTNASIDRSRTSLEPADAGDLGRHHSYVLRMEMVRRRDEEGLRLAHREVAERQDRVREAATAARVIERVVELRDEAREQVATERANRVLDEVGIQGWWRRTA